MPSDEFIANLPDLMARFTASSHTEQYERDRDGVAPQCQWRCEDGWSTIYTTGHIVGGPHDGKFAAQLLRPDGDGWAENKRKVTSTRKAAKAQALRWYGWHSPMWKAENTRSKDE